MILIIQKLCEPWFYYFLNIFLKFDSFGEIVDFVELLEVRRFVGGWRLTDTLRCPTNENLLFFKFLELKE